MRSPRRDKAARESAQVLFVTPRIFPDSGGIEAHIDELAPRLVALGYDVRVLATDRSGDQPRSALRNSVPIERVRAYPRNRDYYFAPGLVSRILRSRADLVHVQGANTLVPLIAMAASLASRTPFVLTLHTGGATTSLRQRLRRAQFWLLSLLLRHARSVIAVSEFEAGLFGSILKRPAGDLPVIRNGGIEVDPATLPAADPNLIVSVGRLERYKGHHRVIQAFAEVRRQNPEARLRILGRGPEQERLQDQVRELGLDGSVTIEFLAADDKTGMAQALAGAGVMVLLSEYEAHPVAVMEALAAGRPVVALRTAGVAELVERGWVTGVETSDSPARIAETILRTSGRPSLADPAELPTWDACARSHAQLYAQLLQRPPGSTPRGS